MLERLASLSRINYLAIRGFVCDYFVCRGLGTILAKNDNQEVDSSTEF
jgi:hypothetical protein